VIIVAAFFDCVVRYWYIERLCRWK